MVTIAGKTVLVTGVNRGIGQALVNEALARGGGRPASTLSLPPTCTPSRRAEAWITGVVSRGGLGDLLDLPPLGQREHQRVPAPHAGDTVRRTCRR